MEVKATLAPGQNGTMQLAFEIIALIFLLKKGLYDFSISNLFYIVLLVGLLGLAFHRKILSNKVWKVIFVFLVFVFFHTWIVMPLIYKFSEGLSVSKIAIIQLFSVPSIPLFEALYIYAWRSDNIWKGSTLPSAAPDARSSHRRAGRSAYYRKGLYNEVSY